MISAAVYSFAHGMAHATELASALGASLEQIECHLFPDGESVGLHQRLSDAGLDGDRIFAPELDAVFDLLAESPSARERPAPRRLQPEVVGRQDWHNDLSRLWLDIEEELDKAADDKARRVILRRVRRALENEHE